MAEQTQRALAGIRVLDLTDEYAYAGKLFSDLGAEVFLIEPPGGMPGRSCAPFVRHDDGSKSSLPFVYLSAGKKSIVLDLESARDFESFKALLAQVDIVLDDRLQTEWQQRGLDYVEVKKINPELVWCAITPFGQSGPHATFQSDDAINMAMGGMASLTGYEDIGPLIADGNLSFYSAAQYAASLSLMAVLGREQTGGGQLIDVSIQEVMLLGTETAPQFYFLQGKLRRRQGENERQAGVGVYPCKDGHVLVYASEKGVGTGWTRLVEWLQEADVPGAEALSGQEWLSNRFKAEEKNKIRFREIFMAFAADRSKKEIFKEGQARRIAIAPLYDNKEVLQDENFCTRESFTQYQIADGSYVKGPGAPYRFSASPWSHGRLPALGEHNAELLGEPELLQGA